MYKMIINIVIVSVLAAAWMGGCAPKVNPGAIKAVEDAVSMEEQLKAHEIPDSQTTEYRVHLRQAKQALDSKKYDIAQREAEAARLSAQRLIDDREKLINEVNKKLKDLWMFIEREPFPKKSVVEACFNARAALEDKRYEQAWGFVEEADRMVRFEPTITRRDTVIVQADQMYYRNFQYIPVFERFEGSKLAGEEAGQIYEATDAKFLESFWVLPTQRFVKISYAARGAYVTGWVEGRFVF